MSIYGDLSVKIDNDTTDRIGIRTLILGQMWQPSRFGLSIDELDGEKPGIPSTPGGVLLIGSQTRPAAGHMRTVWTFEGIEGDGKTVTFKDRTRTLDYSFEPGLSQVSLMQWMGIKGGDASALVDLLKKYQGSIDYDNDRLIWQPTLAAETTGGSGLQGGDSSSDGKTNPMFGHQDFFRMEGTYRCRYASLTLPQSLYSGAGLVTKDIPGGPPATTEKRNWLKVPPRWKRRGLIFDIIEEFWLSGIGGWPFPIYGDGSSTKTGGVTASDGRTAGGAPGGTLLG